MVIQNITQARDQILDVLQTAWDLESSPPTLFYDGVRGDTPTDGSSWARVQVRHNTGQQVSLGEAGSRRFRKSGIVTVQLFTKFGEGLDDNDTFSQVAKNAFEGKSDNNDTIEFRNVRVNEIGQDGEWFQTNILSDFDYDEIR